MQFLIIILCNHNFFTMKRDSNFMKVITIIQARMASSRLPGKVLMSIEGKFILQHIIEFIKHSELTDKIVVATTTCSEDDRIIELCKNLKVDYFRGSKKDVLGRYYECAKYFQGDIIVRITADNPLIDPTLIDKAIKICKESQCDYVSNMINQTYPQGYLVEVFTFNILKKMHENLKDELSREHVTYDIRKNPNLYRIKEFYLQKNFSNWRLTVDYKEDIELISEIFSKLYVNNSYIKLESVIKFLEENNDLLKINSKYMH